MGEPTPPLGLDPLVVPAGGLCLDVACGMGAQSVWAAQNGFDVVALDVSDVAVDATRRAAEMHGVDSMVDCRIHDLDEGLPADVLGECDLVICQRFRRPTLYPKLVGALAPGGIAVVTVLSRVGVEGDTGPFRAPPGDLVDAFRDLSVTIVRHCEADGVATLVARRWPSE